MKYLVTGAAGFIGSHLTRKLLSEGKEVVAVDCFRDYYPLELKRANIADLIKNPSFKLFEKDLSEKNMSWLDMAFDPTEEIIVYHLAAQAGVRKSWGSDTRSWKQKTGRIDLPVPVQVWSVLINKVAVVPGFDLEVIEAVPADSYYLAESIADRRSV